MKLWSAQSFLSIIKCHYFRSNNNEWQRAKCAAYSNIFILSLGPCQSSMVSAFVILFLLFSSMAFDIEFKWFLHINLYLQCSFSYVDIKRLIDHIILLYVNKIETQWRLNEMDVTGPLIKFKTIQPSCRCP